MNRPGGYSKNKEELVSRVLRVKKGSDKKNPETVKDQAQDSVRAKIHEPSGPGVYLNRSTTTLLSGLSITLLISVVYVLSVFFTREQQFDHYKEELRQMRGYMDNLTRKNMALERRLVELQTEIENLQDGL